MDIQRLVDALSAEWQRDRANTQMTLGELVSQLELALARGVSPDTPVIGISSECDSYRGYYCDIAFEPRASFPLHL